MHCPQLGLCDYTEKANEKPAEAGIRTGAGAGAGGAGRVLHRRHKVV